MPREWAESYTPASVNDTVMPCIWVATGAAIRAV